MRSFLIIIRNNEQKTSYNSYEEQENTTESETVFFFKSDKKTICIKKPIQNNIAYHEKRKISPSNQTTNVFKIKKVWSLLLPVHYG